MIVGSHWFDYLGGADLHYVQSVGAVMARQFEDDYDDLATYDTTAQKGTARKADSERMHNFSKKSKRAEQLGVIFHPLKSPSNGHFLSPLMRSLYTASQSANSPSVLRHLDRQPTSIRAMYLPHRLQHYAAEGRCPNAFLMLLLGARPQVLETTAQEEEKLRERAKAKQTAGVAGRRQQVAGPGAQSARAATAATGGSSSPSQPSVYACSVSAAIIVAVVRQGVKLSASKISKWSRPSTVSVEGQFSVVKSDNVARYLHQLEKETRPLAAAFTSRGVRGVAQEENGFGINIYLIIRKHILPKIVRARLDPWLQTVALSRDALAASPDAANVYHALAYQSLYQIVCRCPHRTVLLAWLQAYLSADAVQPSDLRSGELLLAAIVEYWFLGTADPRTLPYRTPAQKSDDKARGVTFARFNVQQSRIQSMPTNRMKQAGKKPAAAGASRPQGRAPVASSPGTSVGSRISTRRQIDPYAFEYVQGSDEVMECITILYMHLYASSSIMDSRGNRRRSGGRDRQELQMFERSQDSQIVAREATCGTAYGGGHGVASAAFQAGGSAARHSFWRSSSEAARVEISIGKPAARAGDRMGADVDASALRTLAVPSLLRAPSVLVRLQGPAFHFFRVHASKLEDKAGAVHHRPYSKLVDALLSMLTPWRSVIRGSHDPELPPDRSLVTKAKPEEVAAKCHEVNLSSHLDNRFDRLRRVTERRVPDDGDAHEAMANLFGGRDERWAAVLAQSYGDFTLREHAMASGYMECGHLPNGSVYGTLVPALSDAQHFERTSRCYRYLPASYGAYDEDGSSRSHHADLGSKTSSIAQVAPAVSPAKSTIMDYQQWEGAVPFHFSFYTHVLGEVFARTSKVGKISFDIENAHMQRLERVLDLLDDRVVGTLYACSDLVEELGKPETGLAWREENQFARPRGSPSSSPVEPSATEAGARAFVLAVEKLGHRDVDQLVRALHERAESRGIHLRARDVDAGYVSFLLQILQQHYAAVGEPGLMETMTNLRKQAKSVLTLALESLDLVQRDILRQEETLRRSWVSHVVSIASAGSADIISFSESLQFVSMHAKALYVDFWGHLFPSASSTVLGLLRASQVLTGCACCCCIKCINMAADQAQQDLEKIETGTTGDSAAADTDSLDVPAMCCDQGGCALQLSELVFGRRRNEPALERLQYIALRLSDVFGLEKDVREFAGGDALQQGDGGLHESVLLQSVREQRKQNTSHSLHLAHVDLLSDQPAWWHGTLLRLSLVADSVASFVRGRDFPDRQLAYKRALIAAIILHQQALDASEDVQVEAPTAATVSALAKTPGFANFLPGEVGGEAIDIDTDWDRVLRNGSRLRWAAIEMRKDGIFEAWYDGFVLGSMPDDAAFGRLLHLGDEVIYGTLLVLLLVGMLHVFVGCYGCEELAALGATSVVSVLLLWLLVPVPPICEPQSLASGDYSI